MASSGPAGDQERFVNLVAARLVGETSCRDCQYLYKHDRGYSNYTVTDTDVICALNKNPHLPTEKPYDWRVLGTDNWPKTRDSRCDMYLHTPEGAQQVHMDVDCEERDDFHTIYAALDIEARIAIYKDIFNDDTPS